MRDWHILLPVLCFAETSRDPPVEDQKTSYLAEIVLAGIIIVLTVILFVPIATYYVLRKRRLRRRRRMGVICELRGNDTRIPEIRGASGDQGRSPSVRYSGLLETQASVAAGTTSPVGNSDSLQTEKGLLGIEEEPPPYTAVIGRLDAYPPIQPNAGDSSLHSAEEFSHDQPEASGVIPSLPSDSESEL